MEDRNVQWVSDPRPAKGVRMTRLAVIGAALLFSLVWNRPASYMSNDRNARAATGLALPRPVILRSSESPEHATRDKLGRVWFRHQVSQRRLGDSDLSRKIDQ